MTCAGNSSGISSSGPQRREARGHLGGYVLDCNLARGHAATLFARCRVRSAPTSGWGRARRLRARMSAVRIRMRLHSSQRSTSSAAGAGEAAQVGRVDLQLAAGAAPATQLGGTDAAVAGRDLDVEPDQVSRQLGRDGRPLGLVVGELTADRFQRGVAGLGDCADLLVHRRGTAAQIVARARRRPPAPPSPRARRPRGRRSVFFRWATSSTSPSQRLRVADGPVGDPRLVADQPLTYRLEVALRPGLVLLEVADPGVGLDEVGRERGPLGLQSRQLGMLGQRATSVLQLCDRAVDGLQVQQAKLDRGISLDVSSPVSPSSRSPPY